MVYELFCCFALSYVSQLHKALTRADFNTLRLQMSLIQIILVLYVQEQSNSHCCMNITK